MKQFFKTISLVLILTLLISTTAYATDISSNTTNKEKDSINQTLNTYFSLQFESVKNKNSNQIDNLSTVIETNTNSGKEIFNYETGKAKFLIASHAVDNTIIEDYSYNVMFTDLKLNNNQATAYITLNYNIKYNFMQDVNNESDQHEISLVKENDKWLICNDVYDNEFKQEFGIGTDFNKLALNAQADYNTYLQQNNQENVSNVAEDTIVSDSIVPDSVPGDYYVIYNSTCRQNAVNYALLYSDDTGSTTSYASYNNSQFNHYNPNDCQDFVSQCIWYGLGGRSSSAKDLPMDNTWWANVSTATNTWVNCSLFNSYITSNELNDSYGVHGVNTSVSNVITGDYVYDTNASHVMFITSSTDSNGNGYTDWSEIYITAHTSNRKNHNLKALYGGISSPPSYFKFVKIASFKWNNGY